MLAGEEQLSHIRKEHMNTAATSCSNGRQFVLSMKRALVIKRKCRAVVRTEWERDRKKERKRIEKEDSEAEQNEDIIGYILQQRE
jgi:hypothetical protein